MWAGMIPLRIAGGQGPGTGDQGSEVSGRGSGVSEGFIGASDGLAGVHGAVKISRCARNDKCEGSKMTNVRDRK